MRRDRSQLSKRDRSGDHVATGERASTIQAASDRDRGDQARDRKAWTDAARFYEGHLHSHPGDAPIWVQLGHARKESSNYLGAEEAYRTAISLAPDDADIPLQLGHLMKLMGRTREAIDFYGKALRLEPSSGAYRELVGLGQTARADRLVGKIASGGFEPTMYLQINDLLHFLRVHKTPSGIQRVQLGIIIDGLMELRAEGEPRVEFVFNNIDDVRVWKASRQRLRRLVDYLADVGVEQIPLRQIVDDIFSDAVLVKPGEGDSFVVLGAFWGLPGNTQLMASLKRQGASIGIYIYDLIPITYPEYCVHQLTVDFTRDLCEALHLIDFAIAISEYSAQELRTFIAKHGFPNIPVEAVPLAHSLTGSQAVPAFDAADGPEWTDTIAELQGRDFVLCVCTIEARKNHRYLFDAWKALKQDGIAVPDLVFVGRRGWRVEEFFAQLENSNYLDGSIKVVHDLSDTELETLYRQCRFTVFPSIVEGWGLPVGESLSYGKLCVSSNASSMPEVGGDLVAYIDPLNLRAGIEILRDLITNSEKVAGWERRIREQFQPRSWSDVSRHLLSTALRLHQDTRNHKAEPPVARLRSGKFLRIVDLDRKAKLLPLDEYGALERLMLGPTWYAPESIGAWMKGTAGEISFQTGLAENTRVVVYLRFTAASSVIAATVMASSLAGDATELRLGADEAGMARLKAQVGRNGSLTIDVAAKGQFDLAAHSPRHFCVGLTAIAFADEQDSAARAELLELLLIDRF